MTNKTWRGKALTLIFAIWVSGCSLFTSYPEQTEEARQAFYYGNFREATECYQEGIDQELNGILYALEAGLVAHTAGNYRQSRELFATAEQKIDELEQRALVSARDVTAQASSLLINDKTIPYHGEFFEKTLLHTYQAYNYLAQGKPESARVEIKKAELRQRQAAREHPEQTKELRGGWGEHPEITAQIRQKLRENYPSYQRAPTDPANIYQLGVTFYLASLVYEILGEHNDSYIDLRKLYQIHPDFQYAIMDLYSKAAVAGFPEEKQKWRNLLGDNVPQITKQTGSLVVFYQCDQAPYKHELFFFIPTGVGFQKVAWPVYRPAPQIASHLELRIAQQRFTTIPVTDLNAVAIAYHRQRSFAQATRLAARLASKIALQYGSKVLGEQTGERSLGWIFALLTSIVTSYTEQADERSWLTLPRNIQFARAYLPAGEYPLTMVLRGFAHSTLNRRRLSSIEIFPGQITLVNVRSVQERMFLEVAYPQQSNYP